MSAPSSPSSSSNGAPKPLEALELVGMTIDRYKLESLVGEGGMGRVYKAVHTVTRRACALKLLPDELCRQPDFVTRFTAEAQTLARLNHPNIVQIYTGGEAQSRFFLEMEFIDGGDLQKRVLEKSAITGTGLPEDEVFRITQGILSALDYAHKQGVIHRDLKPANILLSNDGAVKVSDFGLATVVGEDLHRSRVDATIASFTVSKVASMETVPSVPVGSTGSFAGTILYMSPQALRAERPDPRDDLFSLGIAVYFMLLGKTPSVNYTAVKRQRPELKRDWDKFIATCLAEERSERYQDAAAALRDLIAPPKRSSGVLVAGTVAALVLLTGGGLLYARYRGTALTPKTGASLSPQSIEFKPVGDQSTKSLPIFLNAHASSGLPVRFQLVSGPATLSNSTVFLSGPGIVTIKALQPGDGFFAPATPVERTFKVTDSISSGVATRTGGEASEGPTRKPQKIEFNPIKDTIFGSPIELSAKSTSGLPVSFSVVNGTATLRDNVLTPSEPGRVTVRAVQSGSEIFLPANEVENTFVVEEPPIPQQITLTLPGAVDIVFSRIPTGKAMLGSPRSEMGRSDDETQHPYAQLEPCFMEQTEVTQAQFEAITGTRPSYFRAEWKNRPVEQIRYTDVADYTATSSSSFLGKLNEILHASGYRDWEAGLPSDDEWEYACRAGTYSPFNNNAELSIPVNEGAIDKVAVFGKSETSAVATRAPNAWGLYDMHGNVAEWTQEGALRGGSFSDPAVECRAAYRLVGRDSDGKSDRRFGFRVILRHRRASTIP